MHCRMQTLLLLLWIVCFFLFFYFFLFHFLTRIYIHFAFVEASTID